MAVLRSAIVLPVVLVIIGLLALTMAGFVFFVNAELAGSQAQRDMQQARLTAESGLEDVITVLRTSRDDPTTWWDVPDRWRNALVWAESYTREDDPVRKAGSRKELLASANPVAAWRFSVPAENLDGLPDTMRYGLTPEASKLNLNTASEEEIERLLMPIFAGLGLENGPELIAGLLDWLDEDDEMRPGGAETDYYSTLDPAYQAKNGRLDTLEELLLIKGWSAAVLYGEDTNRNGILDANENDGSASPPYYDNGDGQLNRGVAPYVTVWSREPGQGGQMTEGLVNINTASALVLQALGLAPEFADAIVARRTALDAATLASIDWPVSEGVVPDAEAYTAIKPRLTTKAYQFHVEVLGYADHLKLAHRAEWVVEMRGPVAQVLYHRDLTALGAAWPVDSDTVVVTVH